MLPFQGILFVQYKSLMQHALIGLFLFHFDFVDSIEEVGFQTGHWGRKPGL